MNARYFDVNNYLITATDIRGPGVNQYIFIPPDSDASILHDNGKKYIVSLEWETREGYEKAWCNLYGGIRSRKKRNYRLSQTHLERRNGPGCIEAPIYTNGENIITSCVQKGNRL